MEILIPQYVKSVLETLESNGFEAWCVGGAVRDLILGKNPFDFDITTDAEPEAVIKLFTKTVPTGIKHGTVTVVTDCGNIEITTYRTENSYSDHRAPDSVSFVKRLDEDLKRRDFTVNAICYNPKKGFFDPENGIEDINRRTIRAIGSPKLRFTEDALRILRAFRFSAQLGFKLESETEHEAIKLSYLLKQISVERIYSELKKIFTSKSPEKASPLLESNCFEYLNLPQISLNKELKSIPENFALRFAYLSYKHRFDPILPLTNLKSDNKTIADVKKYSRLLSQKHPTTKEELKIWLRDTDIDTVTDIIALMQALGANVQNTVILLKEIIKNNEPYNIKMLGIDGNYLIALGYSGANIGKVLNDVLNYIIINPDKNNQSDITEFLNSIK